MGMKEDLEYQYKKMEKNLYKIAISHRLPCDSLRMGDSGYYVPNEILEKAYPEPEQLFFIAAANNYGEVTDELAEAWYEALGGSLDKLVAAASVAYHETAEFYVEEGYDPAEEDINDVVEWLRGGTYIPRNSATYKGVKPCEASRYANTFFSKSACQGSYKVYSKAQSFIYAESVFKAFDEAVSKELLDYRLPCVCKQINFSYITEDRFEELADYISEEFYIRNNELVEGLYYATVENNYEITWDIVQAFKASDIDRLADLEKQYEKENDYQLGCCIEENGLEDVDVDVIINGFRSSPEYAKACLDCYTAEEINEYVGEALVKTADAGDIRKQASTVSKATLKNTPAMANEPHHKEETK